MSKNSTLNLTKGPILQTLSRLALPIMASSFLGTAYNITDMAWIGMLGADAVAGIGVGGMYVWLSQGLVSLARMGGQVNVAQCIGRNDREQARDYASASLQLTILFGILFAAVCLLFLDPLVAFFNLNNARTIADAKDYMTITCGLIIFSFLNLTLTGIYTAQGDSKTPFLANLSGLVMNMVLDPLLILGIGFFPALKVTGAAVATVAAQIVVFLVMALSVFCQKNSSNVLRKIRLLYPVSGHFYHAIFRIGVPTALQGSLYCGISMILTRMVSSFGSGAVAVQRVGGQIESLSWNTADGFGAALNAFVGQNFGAKKYDRIHKGYGISFRLLAAWGLLISAAFVFLPHPISELFFHEPEVIKISVGYLRIIGLSEAFMSVELMTVGALSGLGETKICSILSIIFTSARIPLAILLTSLGMGLDGIWWALTLTSVAKGIIFYFTFHHISRKLRA